MTAMLGERKTFLVEKVLLIAYFNMVLNTE